MHPLEMFDLFVAGLAWFCPVASCENATLIKWPRIAVMTGYLSPRVWRRPVCCFLIWMRSGPCFATSNSAWRCGSGTAAIFDHSAHWQLQ